MGKRGKAARKRRRENDVNAAAIASKLIKHNNVNQLNNRDNGDDGGDDSDADTDCTDDAISMETGVHDISDAGLSTTVATLHRLSGLVDPTTGKLALKDKRYRSLRKVLYELQSGSGVQTSSLSLSALNGGGGGGGERSSNSGGVASLLTSSEATRTHHNHPHSIISASKITREISAQIENGAYELAVTTLRNVRKLQEENATKRNTTTNNNNNKTKGNNNGYLRPKLGAVQRWVRQIDAAGTDDPLALQVLDAILRVVAPETILPVGKADLEKATWSRLGIVANNHDNTASSSSSSSSSSTTADGEEGGTIRLFPPFDRRAKGGVAQKDKLGTISQQVNGEDGIFGTLVMLCMEMGGDKTGSGIRQLEKCPSLEILRDNIFRQCGHEKGGDRRPPNKYDLNIVTTAAIGDTNRPGCRSDDTTTDVETIAGRHILLGNRKEQSVVKTPLPYVQDSFLLENALSPIECDRLLAAAETAGFHPDEPQAGQPGASILAHACVWVVDYSLERTIFERVKKFLPTYTHTQSKQCDDGEESSETFQPLGLNRRFRFYRYVPGRYYRPHIDGAWPASGFDRKGNYRYDICDDGNKNGLQFVEKAEDSIQTEPTENNDNDTPGESVDPIDDKANPDATNKSRRQLSRLTFLIYLNDDFDGGHTTFLVPAKEKEGTLNAFPINPVRGGVLVFPHGTCAAPLHEGSPVLKRCKYVVRTEVEYYV